MAGRIRVAPELRAVLSVTVACSRPLGGFDIAGPARLASESHRRCPCPPPHTHTPRPRDLSGRRSFGWYVRVLAGWPQRSSMVSKLTGGGACNWQREGVRTGAAAAPAWRALQRPGARTSDGK